MATSKILRFCTENTGTNQLTDTEYSVDPERLIGNTAKTIARDKLVNKALKQASFVGSAFAYWLSNASNIDITDETSDTAFSNAFDLAIKYKCFAAGTIMLFNNSTAPVGWVRENLGGVNVMLVTAKDGEDGGLIGGIHDPTIMNVVPAHTHGGSTSITDTNHVHSLNLNTSDQGQNHTHNYITPGRGVDVDRGTLSSQWNLDGTATYESGIQNQNHFHLVSGTTGSASANFSHNHTISTDTGSSNTNWNPKYRTMILCTKL